MTIPAGTLVPRDARDFGNYELLAKVATGGMAEIFLARTNAVHNSTHWLVVKRILPHLAEDEHFVTMFRDEANLASMLVHANVCRVFTLGHVNHTWFIAMEYLHGVPLSRMLSKLAKRGKLVDARIVAGMILQACDGLHHAHEARDDDGHMLGVVHRDVSPPNMMLVASGLVKLLDFGIAKARGANSRTRTGTVKGKNAYMSPEQILGKPLDRRSDVFALGAVLYELLSVKRLFHRDSDFLTFKAITEEAIPDLRTRRTDLPEGLHAVVAKALARDPNNRYATTRQFAEALRDAMAPAGGAASQGELATYLQTEFADELAARDELLRAASNPDEAPLTSSTVTSSASMSDDFESAEESTKPGLRTPQPQSSARTPSRPPPLGPPPVIVIPPAPSGPTVTSIIRDSSGNLSRAVTPISSIVGTANMSMGERAPLPGVARVPTNEPPKVAEPTTHAAARAAAVTPVIGMRPITSPAATPQPPRPRPSTPNVAVPPSFADATPLATPIPPASAAERKKPSTLSTTPDLDASRSFDELSTDFLRSSRRRSVFGILFGIVALAGAGIGVYVLTHGSSSNEQAATTPSVIAIDAGTPMSLDAGAALDADSSSRDNIVALSKYGFFSVAGPPGKNSVFIDNQRVGETPIVHLPLKPGVHKVRIVGPRGQSQHFDVTIFGAQNVDHGMITW